MVIPKVFHQLWKTHDTPARYAALRETWLRRNPGWKMRLWSDDDLADLVETHYPQLAPLFHGYRHPIARADLGRYLVLETFGGVYADLDCECLRPLAPLLEGRSLLMGVEPEGHVHEAFVRKRGLTRIVCPSFIASVAGHPFWRDVRAHAAAAANETDVLDQTGPFMLTRAVESSKAAAQVTLAPAAQIYPFTKGECWSGQVFELEAWERASRDAFVAHYWDGGWFREPTPLDGLPWMISAQYSASPRTRAPLPAEPGDTRISCLTVAADAAGLDLALECYRRQTHPNKELLVVCQALDGPAAHMARLTGRPDIKVVIASDPAALLAEGVARATGHVICRWDAGELHDPRRLEIQLQVLRRTQAHACVLRRRLAWRPGDRRLAITAAAPTASSLMWITGEIAVEALADASVEQLANTVRVASFDVPQLQLEVWVPADDGFEAAWAGASARFEGDRCEAVVDELAKRLPTAMAMAKSRPVDRASPPGEVLILTPVKDGRRYLPRYFELVDRLDTGGAPLSIGLIEGDSRDGGYEALEAQLASVGDRFARTVLLQQHDGLEIHGDRSLPAVQRERRAAIARARNRLLAGALGGAEWVLWLDVDVNDYPADLLQRMLATGKDIVAAHCVFPGGGTCDLNTFIFAGDARGDDPAHLIDGLYQPPRGVGRRYLEDAADQDLVRVDSVGGAALLVRAQLHRDGLNFPAFSYGGYIETEGLAMMASDMGYPCWALPRLLVTHTDNWSAAAATAAAQGPAVRRAG
jgi:hypothetical protein